MPDEDFLTNFRKRYALLQEKLAQAQSKSEEEEDYATPSQAERLARARRNRLKMPEIRDLRQQLASKAVEQGHLPASMGASGEWAKFLPKGDDPAAQVKVANAAEAAGLPTVAAAQLAQMAAKREEQRQQHMDQLSQLNQQAEQMKAALHGTLVPGEAGAGPAGLDKHMGRLRQLQEQQGQVTADLQNLKGKDRTQAPKGSKGSKGQGRPSEMKGKGKRKGKVYGKWGKGYGDYTENYDENLEEQAEMEWYWGDWYNYQPWMQAPPPRQRCGRGMQPRGMGHPMSPVQGMHQMAGVDAGTYRSPAEMQAINGMNPVLQRARGTTEVPVRATQQEVQPQTKTSAWGSAASEEAPAEAPATTTTATAASATGAAPSAGVGGTAETIPEETHETRRASAASSALDREGKKEKKEKKDKDADTKKSSKEKKKDPKEDEDAVGKTGSRAQKSWFGK